MPWGTLSSGAEVRFIDHILSSKTGIYYIYDKKLTTPPPVFASRETNRYLAALELLAGYEPAANNMGFAVNWLLAHRDAEGQWDLGPAAKDGINHPVPCA